MLEKKVSIYDIAKKLGISASTVSRALHDNPAISEEVKKSVKQVAKELNFRPNHLAVALKTGKIRTIGIVVPQINRTYFVEAIAGVERELYKAGYDLIIASTGNLYERERNIVDSLSNGKVIGVIAAVAAETTDYSHYQRLIDNNIPVVFFDRKVPGLEASSVVQDDYDAGYNATVHLIEQGCRNIFHFRGPQNVSVCKQSGIEPAILHTLAHGSIGVYCSEFIAHPCGLRTVKQLLPQCAFFIFRIFKHGFHRSVF